MSETDDRTLKCIDDIEFFKLPGFRSKNADLCHNKILENGFCRGKKAGEVCDHHLDCDIGLRCGLSMKCEEAALEGEHCDDEYLLCQSYLYCKENQCIKFGSITNGHPPGKFDSDLCESHYLNSHGVCEEGPTLIGDIFVDSREHKCVYSNEVENYAVCGYHADGKAICKPGEATLLPEWKELLAYLAAQPRCHSYISHLSQCDIAESFVGERAYVRGRIAYAHLHYYTQLQKTPGCVQRFSHPEYFELMKRYNGATTISAFLAALIAVLFVLL